MICLKLNWFFLRSKSYVAIFWICMDGKLLDVFNKFLLIDATDRIKISGDQKRFFYRIKPIPPFIFREHSL